MWRALAVLAGILLAGAAFAEPAFMRFAAGKDELVLTADDIATTAASRDQAGQPTTMVTLSDNARGAFATFTRQHVGRVVDVYVCDVLIVSPTVVSEISGGQVMLTTDSARVVALLDTTMRAKACK